MEDSALHLTVKQFVSNIINEIKWMNIAVILKHDYNHTTLKAFPIIIDRLRNDGYVLLPLFKDRVKVIKQKKKHDKLCSFKLFNLNHENKIMIF